MYLPRGKLLALIAVVVAASMVTATGAFSSVKATRSANIEVVGDKNAYLAIQPADTNNGAYATVTDNNQFKLNIGDIKDGGQGLNKDAVTSMHNVIAITNKGTQTVWVTVSEKGSINGISFYKGSNPKRSAETNAIKIPDGETSKIGVKINTKKKSDVTKLKHIIITAKSKDHSGSTGGSGDENQNSDLTVTTN
jgi:hypothetical protein